LSGVNQETLKYSIKDDVIGVLLWCPRGYPFQCPFLKWLEDFNPYFEETLPFVDDPDLLSLLDEIEICSICLERLKYDRCHMSFAV